MSFWNGKKVLVTGGAGFVGSHLVEELLRRAPRVRVTVADSLESGRRENLRAVLKDIRIIKADLRSLEGCRKACRGQDAVLNLAAHVGGVGYNASHHGTMYRDNMLLAVQMTEAARLAGVERFLVVSSACVYPREATVPTPESEGFLGSPEPTNEGYGWAKRMSEYLGRAYAAEFGMKVAIARPYNTYGPRDHFESENSHVISALIRRVASGEDPVRVWGSGEQSRAFLYVEDFARGLLDVCERHAICDPVNLGTSEEVTIRRLAELILEASGSKAKLKFDPSKPSCQPRRNCDPSRAKALVGFQAKVSLREGLGRTVEWFKANRSRLGAWRK